MRSILCDKVARLISRNSKATIESEMSRTQGYLDEVSEISRKLDKNSIDSAIAILHDAWKNDNQVIIFGNGGSASTATHFACDLNKWVSDKAERKFQSFCASR